MKVQTKIHSETKYSFVEIPKPRGCRNPASEKCSTPLRSLIERVMTAQVFVPVIWELHTQLEETGLVQMGFKCCWPNLTRTQQTPGLLFIRAQLEELHTDLVKQLRPEENTT